MRVDKFIQSIFNSKCCIMILTNASQQSSQSYDVRDPWVRVSCVCPSPRTDRTLILTFDCITGTALLTISCSVCVFKTGLSALHNRK